MKSKHIHIPISNGHITVSANCPQETIDALIKAAEQAVTQINNQKKRGK